MGRGAGAGAGADAGAGASSSTYREVHGVLQVGGTIEAEWIEGNPPLLLGHSFVQMAPHVSSSEIEDGVLDGDVSCR